MLLLLSKLLNLTCETMNSEAENFFLPHGLLILMKVSRTHQTLRLYCEAAHRIKLNRLYC